MIKTNPRILFSLLALPLASISHGQEERELLQTLSLGGYYAEGKYGQEVETEIRYLPLSYGFDYGNWGFQVLTSHLQVDGVGSVLVNLGGITQAVASDEVVTSSGQGDSVVSAIYRLDPISASAPFIDLRLDVKIPTADETKSLGTGEVDYTAQVDLSKTYGKSALFASIGYTMRGDSDIFAGLEDSAFAQIGIAYPINDQLSTGVFYDYREKASEFALETHEIAPFVTYRLSDAWSITGLLTWGFTDASPDQAVLGQLSYRW